MMDKFIKILLDLKGVKISVDDDLADRLNRQHSCCLLLMFSVVVSIRQYFGEAIHCWCPEQCASNHEKYANLYCWVEDTYYVPFFEKMPQPDEPRDQKISYYQWTPLVLMSQAVFFYAPCLLWRLLNRRSGINISRIMEAAISSQGAVYTENRDKTIRYAVLLLDRYLMAQRDSKKGCLSRFKHVLSKHCLFMCGRLYGNYLVCCYVFIKLVYVINAIAQLFLLDIVLGYDYHLFGLQALSHLVYGTPWHPSERFPRVSLCDFKIRQNTNVHRYTVQCVLPINIFNEKIFVIIWFWFLLLSITTFTSLMFWLASSLYWPSQFRFVKRQLRSMDVVTRDNATIRKFAECYLRRDGLFLMRLIAKNAGDMVATELLCGLWENFGLSREKELPPTNQCRTT
ncbi:hypothetical protein CAPTEDRAFT_215984 [Capitella teleta]|uniref:Innexin n=1 Tax=Capitella teleta TaxID=283909 RepID=R7V9G1_CAPTE|nr:hypothetical protein CAPTEDRAFT_215984 [Capitella teleta]|eukprot:ELU15137.1 hypothetical protein CAPTEDRAFT_215984 [Capitella teleta]